MNAKPLLRNAGFLVMIASLACAQERRSDHGIDFFSAGIPVAKNVKRLNTGTGLKCVWDEPNWWVNCDLSLAGPDAVIKNPSGDQTIAGGYKLRNSGGFEGPLSWIDWNHQVVNGEVWRPLNIAGQATGSGDAKRIGAEIDSYWASSGTVLRNWGLFVNSDADAGKAVENVGLVAFAQTSNSTVARQFAIMAGPTGIYDAGAGQFGSVVDNGGLLVPAPVHRGGTMANNFGIKIEAQQQTGARNYGLYVSDQGTGADDWALYVVGGKSRFGSVLLTQPAAVADVGQVALGNDTSATATSGTNGPPPSQVAGYLIINISGVFYKIPLYLY